MTGRSPVILRARTEMVGSPAPLRGHVEIEREHSLPFATMQIARFVITEPDERLLLNADRYRLDMCLTARPAARARYLDHWSANDLEPFGEVYLLPPRQALQVRCVPSVSQSLVCELQDAEVSKWLGEDVRWSDPQLRASLGGASPRLRPMMRGLVAELRRPGLAHEAMIELLTAQLALEIGRFCADAPPAAAGLAPWRLRRIDERLAEDGQAPSLSELAGLCNLSIRQLLRTFRASRGCTVGEHIAQRRAELAKRKLEGPESVKAVARALGFGSPASFTYAFRRATGMTPRDYRAAMGGKPQA